MPRPKPPVQAPPQSAAGVHALPTERFPKPEPIAGPDPTPPRPQPVARAGKPSAVNPPVRTSPRYEDIISEDSMELEEEAAEQRRRRGWIAVAVGGITFGALLGVLLVAATGPFGSGDPDFFFDPGRYDGPAEILEPARLGTSSVRPGDALVSYGPALLMDGDRSTAWQSLPADDGDVFIDLLYDVPVWVTELEFSAGDQSGADAYAATRRPVRVKLTFDGGRAVDVELRDVPAVQRVALDEPRLTGELRITILETVGEDGTGSAMSELSAKGYRADQTDTRTWRAEYD